MGIPIKEVAVGVVLQNVGPLMLLMMVVSVKHTGGPLVACPACPDRAGLVS